MDSFFFFLILCGVLGTLIYRSKEDRRTLRRLEEHLRLLEARVSRLQNESTTRGAAGSPQLRRPAEHAESWGSPPPLRTDPQPSVPTGLRSEPRDPVMEPPPVPPIPAPIGAEAADLHESVPPPLPPLASEEPQPAPGFLPLPSFQKPAFNWEQFLGVRMFAWLGGLALFFAAALGLKYSFEHDLVPPEVRAAGGFLLGAGLLVGGVVLRRREYRVTSQTLCATGVVILYAVTFACHAFYHFAFFGVIPTLLLMVLVTATAFALAVRLDAQVVAVLGMLGGFLTPVVLSTGEDNPLGLFSYLALLDLGLIAVVRRKRWDYLLGLAAAGTVILQAGWFLKFFTGARIHAAQGVFLGMPALFVGAFAWAVRRQWLNRWVTTSAAVLPVVALAASLTMMFTGDLASRPGALFTVVFGADLLLLAMVLLCPALLGLESLGGGLVFLLLSVWTVGKLSGDLLYWAFGLYFIFAALHTLFPGVLRKLRPKDAPPAPVWSQFFPALSLLLILVPLAREFTVPWMFWIVVLCVDSLAVLFAVLAGTLAGLVAVLLLTLVVTGLWIAGAAVQDIGLPEGLLVIGAAAAFFFGAGMLLWRRLPQPSPGGPRSRPELSAATIPALSGSLPFLLLVMVAMKFRPANPSALFGLGALLLALLLGMVRIAGMQGLLPIGLASIALLEVAWQSAALVPEQALLPLVWEIAFYAVFLLFPFVWQQKYRDQRLPWIVSALAGPVQFGLVYFLMRQAYPNPVMGLVPIAFAVPSLFALAHLVRTVPANAPRRMDQLAWFGGVTLFFISVAVPIQFERQWITLGWALEGAALCWLFRRIPHPGLPRVGFLLLSMAFVRLALNPAVLSYHPRTATPILNWYLYTYGVAAASMFLSARGLMPKGYRIMGSDVPPLLQAQGTILLFLLVNLEIADFFSTGGTLTFEFSGNFARDMTYTIAWALFALGLLVAGIRQRTALVRFAGIGLMCVSLLKLFLHDLARLNQLYRIGAFAAVAVVAMLASFLYQRFLSDSARAAREGDVR